MYLPASGAKVPEGADAPARVYFSQVQLSGAAQAPPSAAPPRAAKASSSSSKGNSSGHGARRSGAARCLAAIAAGRARRAASLRARYSHLLVICSKLGTHPGKARGVRFF